MVDMKLVREQAEEMRANIANRGVGADLDRALELYDERLALLRETEALRSRRNDNARAMKQARDAATRDTLIAEGRQIKEDLAALEGRLAEADEQLTIEALRLPNFTHPKTPIGSTEAANRELEVVGQVPTFDFDAIDHVELGRRLGIVDFDAGARVSGAKFYYLMNEGVYLELGLVRFALDFLRDRGFTPMATPDIARTEIIQGLGFNPRGPESNIYTLEGEETALVGTAEITLGGYYAGQTLDTSVLPIRLAGLSHCFRREAGAAGQFSRGLYRVHQFTKVEMFVLATPNESDAIHDELMAIEKEIFTALEIPFRVVDICTGDLGGPAYRKFDLEAWMPGRGESGEWGEITSTSNCTDYQARRLNIRYRNEETGDRGFAHLLNGTAIAISRAIVALLENHQQRDGSVVIPAALRPYVGFDRINPRQ